MEVDKTQLNTEIRLIGNPGIQEFVEKLLNSAPDYFWKPEFGASSSGKYHIDKEGKVESLIDHTRRVVYMVYLLINNPVFPEEVINEDDKDCLIAACILHDCVKRGFDLSDLEHTKFEHPLFVRKLAKSVLTYDQYSMPYVEKILKMVEAHSGMWNTRSGIETKLPAPSNFVEIVCHLADYLASRRGVFIDPPSPYPSAT